MFRTPHKRGGAANLFGSPHRSPIKTIPLNGHFSDGIWKCNCEPRLPAAHFQVKKEGRNHGRWFYTCQQSKDEGCGFFLWDDDAVGREMRAVIGNTRTEPDGLSKSADVEEIAENTEQRNPLSNPETPRKSIKTDNFMTPGSKRKRDGDILPTPATGDIKEEDIFASPSTGRLKGHMWDGNEQFGLRSPSATPTPSRFRDALESEDLPREKIHNGHDISEEVMELLRDQHIDDGTSSSLRALLSKHALRVSGIVKGRDITRVALKTKDAKIAELQQKITALETEREMDKTIIRHFKSDMAEGIASKRGRGRG